MPQSKPIYYGYKPVVLQVEVPSEWCKSYRDLKELSQGYWENSENKSKYEDFDSFANDSIFGGSELRADRAIPASMITNIHY